jgi:hypothetical protein
MWIWYSVDRASWYIFRKMGQTDTIFSQFISLIILCMFRTDKISIIRRYFTVYAAYTVIYSKLVEDDVWNKLRETSVCGCSLLRGPGSSVGIATGYGLDGPGIESRWGEIICTCPDRPWGPSSLLYNGYRVFSGGKKRQGRDADLSTRSSAEV